MAEIETILRGQMVRDGAGVRIHRLFGFGDTKLTDPFLLLDYFGSEKPADYIAGFPRHPHRGIETVTSLYRGHVRHEDSLGNKGDLSPGDLQWMTAGSGIIHEEMPKAGPDGAMFGLQLWVNLPARLKMCPPRYQDFKADSVPNIDFKGGSGRVFSGDFGGIRGPVSEIAVDPIYVELNLEAGAELKIPLPTDHRVLVCILEGEINLGQDDDSSRPPKVIVLKMGSALTLVAGQRGGRCVVIAGKPIRESISWGGPIVMNTDAEVEQAFRDLDNGTFIK